MKTRLSMIAGASLLALGTQARADDAMRPYDEDTTSARPGITSYAWNDPGLQSGIGVGVILGGGIGGFTDAAMRDIMRDSVGGLWDLRVTLGTHTPLGLDISYVGTATGLQTLDGLNAGTLIGTSVEGALRYNILPHYEIDPYLFAGLGWQRYDVVDEPANRFATMQSSDDLLSVPMGAGIAYRDRSGLVADVRGTFRATEDSPLVRDSSGSQVPLHTWEASAALGYEF